MNNKKGLSAIVATVLIILLVIAAVTLVWGPVRNMINKQSKEIEANCLMANPTITEACMSSTSKISLTIENGAEVDIDSFQIIYGADKDNMAESIDNETEAKKNAIVTLAVTNTSEAGSVRIAPIVNGEVCSAGATMDIASSC